MTKAPTAGRSSSTNIGPNLTLEKWKTQVTKGFLLPTALAIYTAYPIMTLMMFRIPEQISWLGLFQNFHQCWAGSSFNSKPCLQLAATHFLILGANIASVWMSYHYFSSANWRRGIVVLFLAGLLGIGVFKFFVDHLSLYSLPPPRSLILQGKTALITGCNRGIGLATALALADQGAHVIVTCRTLKKCQPVVDQINHAHAAGAATAAVLNLSSLESVKSLVENVQRDFPKIHYIFCNAGTTPKHALTAEGLEDGFGGMHLAHMAVVLGLLPNLERAGSNVDPARVIMVSSEMAINAAIGVFGNNLMFGGHSDNDNDLVDWKGEYTRGDGTLGASLPAYARAKLCGILFAFELNERMRAKGLPVIAHAVHTGAVVTASSRDAIVAAFPRLPFLRQLVGKVYFPILWRNVNGGARALLCPALSREPSILRGGQYLDALCQPFQHDTDPQLETTPINLYVAFAGIQIMLDPVQALLEAHTKWSKRLWDASLHFLEKSPARQVVANAP